MHGRCIIILVYYRTSRLSVSGHALRVHIHITIICKSLKSKSRKTITDTWNISIFSRPEYLDFSYRWTLNSQSFRSLSFYKRSQLMVWWKVKNKYMFIAHFRTLKSLFTKWTYDRWKAEQRNTSKSKSSL